jgi:hypothetical protein
MRGSAIRLPVIPANERPGCLFHWSSPSSMEDAINVTVVRKPTFDVTHNDRQLFPDSYS